MYEKNRIREMIDVGDPTLPEVVGFMGFDWVMLHSGQNSIHIE